MTGTPDDRFEDRDLDRLLAQLPPPPAMREGLVDRIVGETQRVDRVSVASPAWRPRSGRRAWTRRGIWTGVVALNLIFASAVAAAFGGGVLSVAKIRAVAATIVEHIQHPHRHAVAPASHALAARQSSVARSLPRSPAAARATTMSAVAIAPHFRSVAPAVNRGPDAHRPPPMRRTEHSVAAFRARRDAEHLGLRGRVRHHNQQPQFPRPGGLRGAAGAGRAIAGATAAPPRADAALGADARPDRPTEGQWQRPTGPIERGGRYGGGWRQRPWQQGPGYGARRFGPAGGLGPRPRRRFGLGGGGRAGGRPFRRRF